MPPPEELPAEGARTQPGTRWPPVCVYCLWSWGRLAQHGTAADASYSTPYCQTGVYHKWGRTRRRAAYERSSQDGRDLYKKLIDVKPCNYVVCVHLHALLCFSPTSTHMSRLWLTSLEKKALVFIFFLKGCWKGIFSSAVWEDVVVQTEREISMVLNKWTAMRERHSVLTALCISSTSPVELQYCLRTTVYIDALAHASAVGVFC